MIERSIHEPKNQTRIRREGRAFLPRLKSVGILPAFRMKSELSVSEALRYLGVRNPSGGLLRETEETARRLTDTLKPRYVYRVFPLAESGGTWIPEGSGLVLTGRTANRMLSGCGGAVLLACTLGARFDALLQREQIRDMRRAAILDACASAWVEAGCDAAEEELRAILPGKFFTDRFSPGYGDLSLEIQPALCAALDAGRRLGLSVTGSFLMNPMKSVTAVIGVSDSPRTARARGCESCARRETCILKKGADTCGI